MILEPITTEAQWEYIKSYAKRSCNFIEFNILFQDKELDFLKEKYKYELLSIGKNKIYSPSNYIRFQLDQNFWNYLEGKKFSYFKNNCIEDPSFYNNSSEIIAIVSHENIAIFNDNFQEIDNFKMDGFKMNIEIDDFGYSPIRMKPFKIFKNFLKLFNKK